MRDDQHGDALGTQRADEIMDPCAGPGIQPRGRLVHDEHIRPAGEDAGDGRQPLLAAGQGEGGTVGEMADPQQLQRPFDVLAHRGLGQPLIARSVGHVLRHRVGEQLPFRMLHHIADVPA